MLTQASSEVLKYSTPEKNYVKPQTGNIRNNPNSHQFSKCMFLISIYSTFFFFFVLLNILFCTEMSRKEVREKNCNCHSLMILYMYLYILCKILLTSILLK